MNSFDFGDYRCRGGVLRNDLQARRLIASRRFLPWLCALALLSAACDSPPGDVAPTEDAQPLPGDAAADSPAPSLDAAEGELVAWRDIAYTPPAGVESELAVLDIFRRDDGETRPMALLVHGGSWVSGDKSNFEPQFVPYWIERGYVAVSVNFRLASRPSDSRMVKPRDQAMDIAAALSWVLDHADEYGIATDGVVLLGYSSGAHLVALLGSDETLVQGAGVDESAIAATISLDVHVYDVPFALELMVGSVVEANIPKIRHLFGSTREEQLRGSPISFVDGWAAPALIISVDADPAVEGSHGYIVSQAAVRYIAALEEAGHLAETFHDEEETHGSLALGFGEPGDRVTAAVEGFLQALP